MAIEKLFLLVVTAVNETWSLGSGRLLSGFRMGLVSSHSAK